MAVLAVFSISLYAASAAAELRTFVKEYTYQASKADDKESSHIIAVHTVKKLLLEAVAADLESVTKASGLPLTKDEIALLSAGAVKIDVQGERWNARAYWVKAKIAADPDEFIKRIDALRIDQEKAKELKRISTRSGELLRENEGLRKEFVAAKGKKKLSVKAAYDQTIKEIRAIDMYEKGFADINLGMYDQAIQDLNYRQFS